MRTFFLVLSFFVAYPVHAGVTCNPIPKDVPTAVQRVAESTVRVRARLIKEDGIRTTISTPFGGSGFVVRAGGRVVTNFHVIEDAEHLGDADDTILIYEVVLNNCSVYSAIPVFTQENGRGMPDVAFLDIINPPQNLKPVEFEKTLPEEGSLVYAIGTAREKINAVVQGFILSTAIEKDGLLDMIYASNHVIHGYSGGPLVNQNGKALGMTIRCDAIRKPDNTISCTGNGYFIPSHIIMEWLEFFEWVEAFNRQ